MATGELYFHDYLKGLLNRVFLPRVGDCRRQGEVTVYVPGVDVTIPVTLSFVMDSFFLTVIFMRETCDSGAPCR